MELIRGFHSLTPAHVGCVATIGNFDGVHLGHQAVLGQLAEQGAKLGLPTVVVMFEPQPQEFFCGAGDAPPRLTRFREKVQTLRRYSVDRIVVLPFNPQLAAMPAEQFIQRLLVDGLGVKYLVVGDDFRFGHKRQGDFELLQLAGKQHGFQVAAMRSFLVDGERVSSTRIRTALAAGDMALADQMLGRIFRLSGKVVKGDQRGRQLGFPTANINLHRRSLPLQGVFAVETYGVEGEPVAGVANIGVRPTFNGKRPVLEVHLLDFSGDLYGRHVEVEILHKIRSEKRFDSLDALVAQIDRDIERARDFFGRRVTANQQIEQTVA